MKVHHLFESKAIAPGALGLRRWIEATVKLTPALEKKRATLFDHTPSKVWTRGDGYRYKEAPYVDFTHRDYADLAWAELLKLPHEKTTLLGPFGSTRNEAYIIGQNVFVKGPEAIFTYRKSSIMSSRVYSLDAGTDNLLLSIIERKLQGKKPIRIHLPRIDTVGEIIGMDGRELTVKRDDGKTLPLLLQFDADVRYSIKDVAGVPTLVKK